MADLKKKFIDILFEEEPDEEELEEYTNRKVEKPAEKKESGYSAKDILYRKPGGSAFINLDDEPKYSVEKDKEIEEAKQEYEMSSQISPIFGVIRENNKKIIATNSVDKSLTDKPDDSHLDIITSPIYGYGNGSQNDVVNEDEEEQLHQLFDNEQKAQETGNEDLDLFKLFGDK